MNFVSVYLNFIEVENGLRPSLKEFCFISRYFSLFLIETSVRIHFFSNLFQFLPTMVLIKNFWTKLQCKNRPCNGQIKYNYWAKHRMNRLNTRLSIWSRMQWQKCTQMTIENYKTVCLTKNKKKNYRFIYVFCNYLGVVYCGISDNRRILQQQQ